jgi:ATP-dependent DNA helicase RecQ
MASALEVVDTLGEQFVLKTLVDFIMGSETKEMKDFKYTKHELFGVGKGKDEVFWQSVMRHAMLGGLIYKEVEQYGVIHMTEEGRKFIDNPTEMMITLNHNFEDVSIDPDEMQARPAALDTLLFNMLKDLRRTEAKKKNVPPYIVFQDPSLEDMATVYPISVEEMLKVQGVSAGKATKFGKPFIALITKYVEDNDIERPQDFVLKQVANQSKTKVAIIKGIDRKVPLAEVARQNQISMPELMDELYSIIQSGTKLSLDHCIDDVIDDGVQDDIYNYFMTAENDDINAAFKTLKEDDDQITFDEIQLMRLKFLSEVAN